MSPRSFTLSTSSLATFPSGWWHSSFVLYPLILSFFLSHPRHHLWPHWRKHNPIPFALFTRSHHTHPSWRTQSCQCSYSISPKMDSCNHTHSSYTDVKRVFKYSNELNVVSTMWSLASSSLVSVDWVGVHMYEMKHINVCAEILAIPGLYDEMTIVVLVLLNPTVLV